MQTLDITQALQVVIMPGPFVMRELEGIQLSRFISSVSNITSITLGLPNFLTPEPPGKVGRLDGGYSLSEQLRWSRETYHAVQVGTWSETHVVLV